jgi:malate synthase
MDALRARLGPERFAASRTDLAARVFAEVALEPSFPEFLTLPAYRHLPEESHR